MGKAKTAASWLSLLGVESPSLADLPDEQSGIPSQRIRRVLVVDESYLTDTLVKILEASGYKVEAAHSGAQTLRMAAKKHYDLVVMEARLPDAKGGEVAQVIRSMYGDTKVILMTGDQYWKETVLGAPSEVDAVLLKPFPPEKLIWAAKMVLPKDASRSKRPLKLPLA